MKEIILEVENLKKYYEDVKAVDAMKATTGISPMSALSFWLTVVIMFFGAVLVLFGFSKLFKAE